MTPHRLAASLVEILVVVAIVVVLGSLLLPGLKVVMESARTVECQGNMRQIGMAQDGFAQDNRGYVCPADGFGWWDASRYWNVTLADYVDDDAARQSRGSHGRSVSWGCPAWAKRQEYVIKALQGDSWSYLYTGKTPGYAMSAAFQSANVASTDEIENSWWFIDNNRYITPNPDPSASVRWANRFSDPYPLLARLPQIPFHARQPLVIDGYMHFAHPWFQAYATPLGRNLVIERHRGKGSVLYLDGHTGLVRGAEWTAAFWRPDL